MSTAQETGRTVQMITSEGEFYFDPIGLHVQPGETVTFENASGSHTSTAYRSGVGGAQEDRIPDDAEAWDSGTLTESGATFEHTFDVDGTYDYFCIPHKSLGMVGRIVVGEPGGPAEGSMPPDGEVPSSDAIVDSGSISHEAFTSGGGTGGSSAGGGSGGGSDLTQPAIGTGLLVAMAVLAGVVYRVVNSEGERYRVGSAAWRRKYRSR